MKKNIKSVGVLLLSSIMLMSSPLTVLAEENETVQTQENGSIDKINILLKHIINSINQK